MDPLDKLTRAYARLVALHEILRGSSIISERYVTEYHEALKHISDLGHDVAEFSVPERDLQHRVSSSNFLTRETRYSRDRYVAGGLFLAKLTALLSYFSMLEGRAARPIGFRA